MRSLQLTSAAIPPARADAGPQEIVLPEPPQPGVNVSECVSAVLLVLGAWQPAAAPLALCAFFVMGLWHGVASDRRERAYFSRLERLANHHVAARGLHHPLSVSLRRYQRVLDRVLHKSHGSTMRGQARRWALVARLHHRCQHLLEYPDFMLPPSSTPSAIKPAGSSWLPGLSQRSRRRRLHARRIQ